MSSSASFRVLCMFLFSSGGHHPFPFLFMKRINMDQKGWCLFFTSPSLLLLFSVATHSIPTVSRVLTDGVPTISGAFELLRLFLFTLTSSLRRLNSESNKKKKVILDELLLKVFATKSDSVYVLVESVVLKPVWVWKDADFSPSLLPLSTIPILIRHILCSFRSVLILIC